MSWETILSILGAVSARPRRDTSPVVCTWATLDVGSSCVRVVLDHQLLKKVKGFLMGNLLADLHNGLPRIIGLQSMALITHLI